MLLFGSCFASQMAAKTAHAFYWPEFARGGKGDITVLDILLHPVARRMPCPRRSMFTRFALMFTACE